MTEPGTILGAAAATAADGVRGASLRVAVLLGAEPLERWQADAIGALAERGGTVCGSVRLDGPTVPTWPRSVRRPRSRRVVAEPASLRVAPALRLPSAGARAPTAATLSGWLASTRPDVLLAFVPRRVARDIVAAFGADLPHGAWVPRLGERDGPWERFGVDELLGGAPTTSVALERLDADGRISVLREARHRTVRHSLGRTVDPALRSLARSPAALLAAWQAGDATAFAAGAAATTTAEGPTRGDDGCPPGRTARRAAAVLAARLALVTGWHRLRWYVVRGMQHDRWAIGIVDRPVASLLADAGPPLVRWLRPPEHGVFYADPFGHLTAPGRLELLCERFSDRQRRGTIVALEVTTDGLVRSVQGALQTSGHASYPFLLEHDLGFLCFPETAASRRLELYRAGRVGGPWTRASTLIDGFAALDPTVAHHDGTWWLFCGDADGDPNAELHLWWADDPLGPWRPHPANPVKVDVRSARPAGPLFMHGGALYRPAQDCSRTYGGRVVICRVLELSRTRYREERAAAVEPHRDGPYPHGLHTLSAVGDLTLVDGKVTRFVPGAFLARLKSGASRVRRQRD